MYFGVNNWTQGWWLHIKFLRELKKKYCFHLTAGEGAAAEATTDDMPPLEGEEGDDSSKMEEVD